MIRLIARRNTARYVQGFLRLADPDVLLDIARKANEVSGPSQDASYSEQFSRVLHDIRMSGVWKRTNAGRLTSTERVICKHMSVAGDGPPLLLDIGASDGVTTVDLLNTIRRVRGLDARIFLADVNLRLERYRIGPLVEYRAVDGEAVMVRIGRLGMRLAPHRRVRRWLTEFLPRRYLNLTALRRAMQIDARISLVNPIAAREVAITVREMNCLERQDDLVGKLSAVRASNVLNVGYFAESEIQRALDHVFVYLREGGCLVVSRNIDTQAAEMENGSIWRRSRESFRWIEDFGSGSEIKGIVDSWRIRSP